MSNRIAKHAGHSLLELLVVLMLSSALAGSSYLALGKMRSQLELRQTAGELSALLHYASELAVSEQRNISLRFEKSQVLRLDRSGWREIIALPEVVKISAARFGSLANPANEFSARASGTSTPGKLVLVHKSRQHCEIVTSLYAAVRHDC